MSDYSDNEVLDAACDLVARWDDDKKYEFLEHRIRCMNIMRSLLQEREGLRLMLGAKPAMMSTPIGLLPVDSEGMRKLVDYAASLTLNVAPKQDSKNIATNEYGLTYNPIKPCNTEMGKGPWSFQE